MKFLNLFKKKKQIWLPDNSQKFFISNPCAKLNWFWNREPKIQKWIMRLFLIALAIWILVAVCMGIAKGLEWRDNPPKELLQAKVGGIIDIVIIGIVFTIWLMVLAPILKMMNTGHVLMLNFGGQGMLYNIVKDGQIEKIAIIFAVVGAMIFLIALAVRGIKIAAARNAEIQEGYKQNTALSIAGAVLGIFLLTAVFFFITSFVCQIGTWLIQTICGINSVKIGTLVFNYGWVEGIQHWADIPPYCIIPPVSVFPMTLLLISAVTFLMKFAITIFGSIMKIAVMYISAFIALGKWPQDEGGSFQNHKDDIISLMLHYLIAYFVFQFFMVLIATIAPMAEGASNLFCGHTIIALVLFAGGTVSLTQLQHRLPQIYMSGKGGSNNIEASPFAGADSLADKTYGKAIDEGADMTGKKLDANKKAKDKYLAELKKKDIKKNKKVTITKKQGKALWKEHRKASKWAKPKK